MFLRFSDETGPVRGVRQVEASASRVSRFHLPEKKKKKRKKKTQKNGTCSASYTQRDTPFKIITPFKIPFVHP